MVGLPRKDALLASILTLGAVVALSTGAAAAEWWENVKVKGDLRYRHEMIDTDDRSARHRHRVRARVGVHGVVSEYATVGVQLATGSDDPVSTNQTLGDAFSTKRIGLDMAYVELNHPKLPGLALTGGKFDNPFFKPGGSELIWDSDFNPEGGVVTYERDFNHVSLLLVGSGLWVLERSSGDDSWMGAGQGVVRFSFNEEKTGIAVGAGFFDYVNVAGFEPFYDPDDLFGNSGILAGTQEITRYAFDYELLEILFEATHEIEEIPVTVMADFVANTAGKRGNSDEGWLAGLRAGKAKKPGEWDLRYIYRELEADAVLGIITDSDFRGGGTDAKGHEMGGSVVLASNTAFSVTYFINEIGLRSRDPESFTRLQVDLQLKF